MATQQENAIINLVINGQQAIGTYQELNRARAEQFRLVQQLNRNAPNYQEQQQRLTELTAAQSAWRSELMQGTRVQQQFAASVEDVSEKQKGFFADFKDGWKNIGEMAGQITAGTLIYKGVSSVIGAIKGVWNSSEAAFVEAEKTQAQLGAVLKSTGGAAGIQMDALVKLQQAEMDKTGVDDDVIAKGEEMLLTFGNISGKIYDQVVPAVVDMTAAMNGGKVTMEGIQATSLQVGKALNDPINGLTSLRKVGVSFNDQQKEQIKTMQQSGDLMGAQSIILKELQKEFGGTAEAIKDTSSGALDVFNTDLGNLEEKIGSFIVSVKGWFAGIFDPLIKELGSTTTAGEEAANAFDSMNEKVKSLDTNIVPLLQRYDELQAKTSLSKTEHIELNDIIDKVDKAIPGIASEFDAYGKAIGLSTDKAMEFIAQQKNMLAYLNRDAIQKTTNDIKDYTDQVNKYAKALKTGFSYDAVNAFFGGGGKGIKLNEKQLADIQQKLTEFGTMKKGAEEALKKLQGITDPVAKDDTTSKAIALQDMTIGQLKAHLQELNTELDKTKKGTDDYKKIIQEIAATEKLLNDPKKDNKAANERAATVKSLQALAVQYQQFDAAEISALATKNQKEQDLLANKYDNEITKQKEGLSAKRITQQEADAIEIRLAELKKDKQGALDDLRQQQEIDLVKSISGFNERLTGKLQTEYQKQLDDINAFYDAKLKAAGDSEEAINKIETGRTDALEAEKIKQAKDLADILKKVTGEGKKNTLGDTRVDDINKKYDDEITALESKFSDEVKQTQAFADVIKRINKNRDDDIAAYTEKKEKQRKKDEKTAAIETAQSVSNAIFDIARNKRQAETDAKLSALNKEKEAELSNANLTSNERAAINQKYADQEKAIKLAAWQADKDAALEQAVINGALAVVKALPNFYLAAAAGVAALAQIAVIEGTSPPTYADGGIPQGPSHADGGMNLVGPYGQIYGQIEGGEPVLSKKAYANNKGIVDALLNSGGQPLNYDKVIQATTSREARRSVSSVTDTPRPGASSSTAQGQAIHSTVADHGSRISGLERMMQLQAQINEREVVMSRRVQEQEEAKVVQTRNAANG